MEPGKGGLVFVLEKIKGLHLGRETDIEHRRIADHKSRNLVVK